MELDRALVWLTVRRLILTVRRLYGADAPLDAVPPGHTPPDSPNYLKLNVFFNRNQISFSKEIEFHFS